MGCGCAASMTARESAGTLRRGAEERVLCIGISSVIIRKMTVSRILMDVVSRSSITFACAENIHEYLYTVLPVQVLVETEGVEKGGKKFCSLGRNTAREKDSRKRERKR